MTTKRAKCPGCLPDIAGAIFESREGSAWTCRNCGHQLKTRARKVSPERAAIEARLREELRRMEGDK